MLIWINGAFGAGKTQTAFELRRRLVDAHVADPELLGFAFQRTLPPAARHDFQDLAPWRSAVVDILQQVEAAHTGPVLVPMTIVRDDYFDEIIGGLRSRGVDVRHYALIASPETLRKRLSTRIAFVRSGLRRETWAVQQIPRCVSALAQERYATHVDTDQRTTDEVVEWIADDAGLSLAGPRLAPWRYQLRRLEVGIGHIR
ncbi:AAA family ATPase [Cellulomonas xiejunii]|uniref:AAA family ATPase n=1 Tax=Cellulomonas xiejunii TaxID=2968083 RepID=A0ABY5KMN8_9CELL|nr:AAA family ATPase [Cellulomonas xiejunii]MCC2321183.1 AAA family ATPase [Cellulomonas xiejunii]UUI71772.1 AAA family ATPase [Cellulomonas xiejunii]